MDAPCTIFILVTFYKFEIALIKSQIKVCQWKKRLMQERCQLIEIYLEIIRMMGFSRSIRGSTLIETAHPGQAPGDPDKKYGTNKPPPTGRVREKWKGDTACPSTSQNCSCQHQSWLRDACATRKDSELE